MVISGVYKIVSIANPERCYIGSSQDIYKRWEQHLAELQKGKHHSTKLQRHYDKYGKNDLQFSILLGCDKEELISAEQYFIDIYLPYFNGRLKAFNNGGYRQSAEEIQRKRDAFSGKNNPNYGKTFSEEHRRKISESRKGKANNKGYKYTDEAKKKLSEARKGQHNSINTEFKKGQIFSEEYKKKVSDGLKGRVPWNKGIPMRDETRKKLIASRTGKPHPNKGHKTSEETKAKISRIKKEYYMKKRLLNIVIN